MSACRFFISLCFFFILSLGLRAAVLTFEDCVRHAEEHSPELQAAKATLKAARFERRASFSAFLPQISANMDYSKRSAGSTASWQSSGNNYGASLSGSQSLFAGFQDFAKFSQSAARLKSAEASFEAAKSKLSFDLKSAFHGLLFAKRFEELTRRIAERREGNLKLVDLRYQSGRENLGSVQLSKAYLAQARYDVLQASNLRETAKIELAKAIGLSAEKDVDISGEIALRNAGSPPDYLSLAQRTPDYIQTAALRDISDAQAKISRAGFLPSLDFTGSYGKTGNQFFPDQTNWSLGANLSIPIFSGFRTLNDYQGALSSLDAHTRTLAATEQSLVVKLRQAFSAYIEASEKLKVDEAFHLAATTRAEIARKKYNSGLLTFDEWDIIESDLISRQKAYVQSKRSLGLSEATWEQAQGVGVIK